MIDISTMTKDEKSIILYAETCIVDKGSLMEGARMNAADHEALKRFQAAGILTYGRILSCCPTPSHFSSQPTHWVRFTDEAWTLATALRRQRATQLGPYSTAVFAAVDERAARAA